MAKPFAPSPLFTAAKAQYDAIQHGLAMASERLRAIPGISSGPMGLTPDSVKQGAGYRSAKASYDHWHAMARAYNRTYTKAFARELAAERAARRSALIQAA